MITSAGIDLSLTGTGLVILNNGKMTHNSLIKTKPSGKSHDDELKRLILIKNTVIDQIIKSKATIAVIEGLAFMARNTTALVQLAGLNYLLRQDLYLNEIPFKIVAPTTLKKFVTGKGNTEKGMMLLETYKRYGISFENDNECDAYGLAMIGHCMCDPKFKPTVFQQEVITLLT